jgi:hypothetical protein
MQKFMAVAATSVMMMAEAIKLNDAANTYQLSGVIPDSERSVIMRMVARALAIRGPIKRYS